MSRFSSPIRATVLILPLLFTLAPCHADARPGGGSSMGSRGSRTWSAPSSNRYSAAPMERSITPSNPSYGSQNSYRYGNSPFQQRRPSGLGGSLFRGFVGGMLGAGLFGLLTGHGFFGGVHGLFSMLGFMIQVGLLVLIGMWLFRKFSGQRQGAPAPISGFPPAGRNAGNFSSAPAPVIGTADYQAFQTLLLNIQAAWNTQDIRSLQNMATPEMVSYFNEQLSTLTSRGERNQVSNVRFLNGDLVEAWSENGNDYATVFMRYSLIDITTNMTGHVVDGNPNEPVTIAEIWTFIRPSRGGAWLLSAIQQTNG